MPIAERKEKIPILKSYVLSVFWTHRIYADIKNNKAMNEYPLPRKP